MTFDPFGDFDKRGYLRNIENEKDPKIVRRLEHSSFTISIDDAFKRLAARRGSRIKTFLDTHQILFGAVYPWAGQDRLVNASKLVVSKGNANKKILFAYPQDIKRVIEYALEKGREKQFMGVDWQERISRGTHDGDRQSRRGASGRLSKVICHGAG